MNVRTLRLATPIAVCVCVLMMTATSASALAPHVRAIPHKNLTDSQSVTVRWRNFDPTVDSVLEVVQCTPSFVTDGMQTHCDLPHAVTVNPATAGGTTPYTVHTGNIGDGTCGTSAADASCVIAVIGIGVGPPPGPVAGQVATNVLRFAVA
jgi:hypothetical protein